MTDLVALKAANANPCLSQHELMQLLTYSPETGEFRWLVTSSNRAVSGSVAGSQTSKGYVAIQVLGQRHLAHRLAWLYMTGEWPSGQIDHKDRRRSNNRWSNLREASNRQNAHNVAVKASSKTGLKGVHFIAEAGLFTARIRHDGKRISLGCYRTAEEAHLAYVAKAEELLGEFARAA